MKPNPILRAAVHGTLRAYRKRALMDIFMAKRRLGPGTNSNIVPERSEGMKPVKDDASNV